MWKYTSHKKSHNIEVARMYWLGYTLMCLTFGTTFFAITIGDKAGLPPFWFAGLRFVAAGLITYALLFLRKPTWPKQPRVYAKIALLGILSTFGTFSTLFWSEQYVASGYAALLSALGPFMLLGLQLLFTKRKISWQDLVGTAIGFLGVLCIIAPKLHTGGHRVVLSTCLVLLGELSYTIGALYARRLLATGLPTFVMNGGQMLAGGLALCLLATVTEPIPLHTLAHSRVSLVSLVYLTLIGSVFAHGIYFWLVRHKGVMFPSTWLYVSPIIAVVVGALYGHERVSLWLALGVPLVLIGMFFVEGYKIVVARWGRPNYEL
jgi:drug/metabolite transporter (DMT)-like permease